MSEKVKVLYVAGTMRSGSTILGRLLGELPNTVHVGEIGVFTGSNFQATARCECRQMVSECSFWSEVFARAFGGLSSVDLTALERTRQEYRMRTVPRLLLPQTSAQARRLREYRQVLGALYTAIRDVSGARVIVDGSKDPLYAWLLSGVPDLDFYRVDLVRDSRAVAFSQQRVKKDPARRSAFLTAPETSKPGLDPHSDEMLRLPPWRTALSWNCVGLFLEATRRLLGPHARRLRYEDFVAAPAETLRALWEFVGEPAPPLEFLLPSPLCLPPRHTVAGNPDRFQPEVRLRADLEWQQKMRPFDRRLVTALTLPLLRHYGYGKLLPPPHT